ncbi:MAG: hypothetical protein GOMPHAMPRED_007268 [Gomphillus americanus]|uniref:Uncharacterized protein n=1 Tax=Gomphillus americanus TaxID=1940652 RepID=A0A8H3IAC7_9LECA|nr:MAG: hypothetical protein GOMPHAMPRED_007268 [Gomphillus americanus]
MAADPLSNHLDERRLRFGQLDSQRVEPESQQQEHNGYMKPAFAAELGTGSDGTRVFTSLNVPNLCNL